MLNKTSRLCSIAFLFAAALSGQKIYDPGARVNWLFCECKVNGTTTTECLQPGAVPIVGDPVTWSQITSVGSGFHTHELAAQFGDLLRPRILFGAANQTTGGDGCVRNSTQMPQYAGVHNLRAQATLGQGIDIQLIANSLALLMDFIPGDPSLAAGHTDPAHANLHEYLQVRKTGSVLAMARDFYHVTGKQVDILRASLPWGGTADNDYLKPVPGLWDQSVRTYEEHATGLELDVFNPSAQINFSDGFTNATILEGAALANGCSFGKRQPGSGAPITDSFWWQQGYIHIVCDPTRHRVPRPLPPGPID